MRVSFKTLVATLVISLALASLASNPSPVLGQSNPDEVSLLREQITEEPPPGPENSMYSTGQPSPHRGPAGSNPKHSAATNVPPGPSVGGVIQLSGTFYYATPLGSDAPIPW